MKEGRKTYYGWLIVLYGALVMSTLHYTCFNSFGLFVVPVTEGLGISRAAFSLTMTVGVAVGTFSTLFVACPMLLALGDRDFYVKASKQETYEKPGEHGMV